MKSLASCSASAHCLSMPKHVTLTSSFCCLHALHLPCLISTANTRKANLCILAAAEGHKRRREAPRRINLNNEEMMELEFGRLLGEKPKETLAKVMRKNTNLDVAYLDIERSVKAGKGLHLEHPLQSSSKEGEERQQINTSNDHSVQTNNTGTKKTLDLIRPIMKREGKSVIPISDTTKLAGHTKALRMESDPKDDAHRAVLRKPPFARNQVSESPAFMPKPMIPHMSLKRSKDSVKRNLEDTGLLRRPETATFDSNLEKSSEELKTKACPTEHTSGSKGDGANTCAIAEKYMIERGDDKRDNRISMIRPTMLRDPTASTTHEVDSRTLHGKVEDENSIGGITSQSNQVENNLSSLQVQTMGRFASRPSPSNAMPQEDTKISSLPIPLSVKMETMKTKEHLLYRDCKEDREMKAESQPIQWAGYGSPSIESRAVESEDVISVGPSTDLLSETTSVENKSPESLNIPGLANEVPLQHSHGTQNVANTSSVMPSCKQDFEEKTDNFYGAANEEKNSFQLSDSISFASSMGTEHALRNPLYRMDSVADSRHAKQFERGEHTLDHNGEILAQAVQEGEDDDWARAEALHESGGVEEVEFVSCNSRGFAVSFGSLIGLLPYRDLRPKRKPFSFEAWLRHKGLDPSKFKKDTVSEGNDNFQNSMLYLGLTSAPKNEDSIQDEEEKSAAVMIKEYQDLLNMYDQERTSFLSSFVGQKTRAGVTFVDRKTQRLLFSEKLRESRAFAEKKANLMDKLNVGEVVTCRVTRFTSFGVFVELEGIPALIHQSELSWDPIWDAKSVLKDGEIVDAKVCKLDRSLQRINLSLKQMKPDPLLETLESVVGEEGGSLNRNLQLAEKKTEWPELETLIKELKLVDGIQSVSKGRFLLSPGLAPNFQVYMSDSHGTKYKLLARSGNRVQEVVVQASLDRDGMKSAILCCTSRLA